jgi:hypothetical protein
MARAVKPSTEGVLLLVLGIPVFPRHCNHVEEVQHSVFKVKASLKKRCYHTEFRGWPTKCLHLLATNVTVALSMHQKGRFCRAHSVGSCISLDIR